MASHQVRTRAQRHANPFAPLADGLPEYCQQQQQWQQLQSSVTAATLQDQSYAKLDRNTLQQLVQEHYISHLLEKAREDTSLEEALQSN